MESAFSLRPDNKKQTVRRCGSMRGAPKRKSEQPVVNHLGDPCIWLRDLQHFDGPPFRRLGESESTGWKLSLLHLFGGEGGLNKSALLDCVEYLPTWKFLISLESERVQLTMRSKEAVNHFDQVLSFPLGSSQRRWLGGMEWIFWWSLLSFPGEWFNAADPFNYSWKLKLVHLHFNMDSAV